MSIKKLHILLPIFLLLQLSTFLSAWDDINGGRGNFNVDSDFHLLYGGTGSNIFGDFTATGNSILSSNNPDNANLITDTTTYKNVDTDFNNNAYSLGDTEKMNSSSADIVLPSYVKGSDIVWAGLFWQGHIYRKNGSYTDAQVDSASTGWNSITIKDSLGFIHAITSPIGSDDANHKAFYHSIHANTGFRHHYGAYHDITSIIQNSYSSTNKTFTVGNIKTTAGKDEGGYVYITQAPAYSGSFKFGLYGGWSLIVVYNVDGTTAVANSVPTKSVSIYDGFDLFLTWGNGTVPFETTIDLNGFYTPKTGIVNSKLLLFGGAGDRNIDNDTLQIEDGNNPGSFNNLTNSTSPNPNPTGSQFNHSYTNLGMHMTPDDKNKQGMDLDIFDISSSMKNGQTSTKIKFGVIKSGGSCDQIFPQVIAFSTQLYEPQFCYDYAYKQDGTYFTEENDGSKDPKLSGSLGSSNPIEVTIFLKNLVDTDLAIEDMKINILDINTSQVTYISDSVKRALSGELYPTEKTDAGWGLTTTTSKIQNIPIGNQVTNDYFYIYYSLDPKKTDLNDSLNINITYNLNIGQGDPIPYDLTLGANVPMCSTSNFNYTPAKGQFIVVDKSIYSTNQKYNLPTQVTNREANLQVISVDEDFSDDVDTLTNVSTMVAVEMIDVASFHYTDASCREADSAITDKVWLLFENNVSSVDFTSGNTSSFYATAKQNAAFRVTYNAANQDGDLMEVETLGANSFKLTNFPSFGGDSCNPQYSSQQVSTVCGNNGNGGGNNGMTSSELKACMSCIYGKNTRFVCSRDNFSIRPEAFALEFEDQDQNAPTTKLKILDSVSGNNSPTLGTSHLASAYQYNLNIKAVTHKDTNPSLGYTMTYNDTDTATLIRYDWEPSASTVITGCNDTTDKFISSGINSFKIVDGDIDINTSVQQVGEYRLNMKDTVWTTVDFNPTYMTHHDSDTHLFASNIPDCVVGSSATIAEGNNGFNGCNISSEHNTTTSPIIKYKDYKIEFHPYKFDMTGVSASFGENNSTTWPTKPYIYMSDISQDQEMSFHLNGAIKATGYTGTEVLNNFVNSCYAYPVQLDVNQTGSTNTVALQYRYHNVHDNALEQTGDLNTTNSPILLVTSDFVQDQNGSIDTVLNINFARNQKVAVNPETITYNNYKVKCQNTIDCSFQADLALDGSPIETLEGVVNGPITIEHYYGRTNAPRQRYEGSDGNESIYFEVFCDSCDKTKLQNTAVFINDPRWLTNTAHTLDFGKVGTVSQKYTNKVTATTPTNTVPAKTTLHYTGTVYPYKATMQNTASRWLIYNKFSATTPTNDFEVEFESSNSSWSGVSSTDSKTVNGGASKTNRRIMW